MGKNQVIIPYIEKDALRCPTNQKVGFRGISRDRNILFEPLSRKSKAAVVMIDECQLVVTFVVFRFCERPLAHRFHDGGNRDTTKCPAR